jgi:hypothetical protein
MNAAAFFAVAGILVLLGLQVWAASRFIRRISARVRALGSGRVESRGDLPLAIDAFARRGGAGEGPAPRVAGLTQSAELRLGQGAPFRPIRATQHVALASPGFVWDAVRRLGPLPLLRVVDAYDGATGGLLEARALGSVPVASKAGGDIALGEALRYLAELPWAPDAILCNPHIGWRMIDASHAEATLRLAEGFARVTFSLDADGDIVRVVAKDRPALDARGRPARYDWRGRFWGYRRIGPRRIPEWGEVGYVYPEGYEVYFRGRILTCELVA